jgi:hypothetical protein
MSSQFTKEEAILLAKALARAQENIDQLEDLLETTRKSRDNYRDYWLEECEKTKALEEMRDAVDKVMITEGEPLKPSDLE